MSTSDTPPTQTLARRIAFLPLIGIIFFNVSGGAYSLEELISSTGPGLAILLLVLVPIFYGAPIAAITTELATAIPVEGGTYVWVKRTMGGFMAYQAGILRWINSWIDMAIFPVLFTGYFSAFVPWAGRGEVVFLEMGPIQLDLAWVVGVVCVIIPMAMLNIRGSKSVGDSALLFMIVSLLPLLIIAGLGIYRLVDQGVSPIDPFIPEDTSPTTALAIGLSVVMWAYCAFDRVGLIAGEIKNPGKTIPKAMVVSIIVIAATYILPLVGAMSVPGWEDWFAGSFSDVALALGGPWLQVFVTIGGMFCAIGLYSSLLMSSTRTPFVLAQDRWLSPALSKQTRKSGSPVTSIIVSSVIYAIFTTAEFLELVVLDVFLINLLLLFNLAALIILRIKEPNLPRPARLPWGWVGIALVGVPLAGGVFYLFYLQVVDYGILAVTVLALALIVTTISYFPAKRYRARKLAAEAMASE